MKRDEILQKVKDIVGNYADRAGDISENFDLHDDMGLDSLDFIQVIMDCEDEFGININEDGIHTIGQLIDVIEKAVQ